MALPNLVVKHFQVPRKLCRVEQSARFAGLGQVAAKPVQRFGLARQLNRSLLVCFRTGTNELLEPEGSV